MADPEREAALLRRLLRKANAHVVYDREIKRTALLVDQVVYLDEADGRFARELISELTRGQRAD